MQEEMKRLIRVWGSQLPPAAGFILRGAIDRHVRESLAGEDLLHGARGDLLAIAVAAEVAEHDVP